MTVRIAVLGNDGLQERDGADAQLMFDLLQGRWALADLTALIRRGPPDYVLIDRANSTALWGQALRRLQEIRFRMWLWDGRGDFFERLMPLAFACTRAVISDFPQAAAAAQNWAVLGHVPGKGDTDEERAADAQLITERISIGSRVANVDIEADDHPGHRLIRGHVSDVLAADT